MSKQDNNEEYQYKYNVFINYGTYTDSTCTDDADEVVDILCHLANGNNILTLKSAKIERNGKTILDRKGLFMNNCSNTEEENVINEWLFLEKWLPNYSQCDEVAWVDDIDKVLNHDYEEGDCCEWCLDLSINELKNLRNEYMAGLLRDAMENYINVNYPTEENVD